MQKKTACHLSRFASCYNNVDAIKPIFSLTALINGSVKTVVINEDSGRPCIVELAQKLFDVNTPQSTSFFWRTDFFPDVHFTLPILEPFWSSRLDCVQMDRLSLYNHADDPEQPD